jgi:hypothetical protein
MNGIGSKCNIFPRNSASRPSITNSRSSTNRRGRRTCRSATHRKSPRARISLYTRHILTRLRSFHGNAGLI